MLDHEDYPKAFIINGNTKFEFFNAQNSDNTIFVNCVISKC